MLLGYFRSVIKNPASESYLFPSLRLVRVVRGGVEWMIGESTYTCQAGDVLLLNNLTARKMISLLSAELCFDVFEFLPAALQGRPKLLSMFYSKNAVIVRHAENELLHQLLDSLALCVKAPQADDLCFYQAQAVFSLLEKSVSDTTPAKGSTVALEAANYIWESFAEPISVPSVAKRFHTSKSNLEKEFKRVHGLCVAEYIRSIRVYQAHAMLDKHPDKTVLDVAFSCGFRTSSGFYKAYTAVMKKSPKR